MSMGAIFHPSRPHSFIHPVPPFPPNFLLPLSLFVLSLFTSRPFLPIISSPFLPPLSLPFPSLSLPIRAIGGWGSSGGENNGVAAQVFGCGDDRTHRRMAHGVGAHVYVIVSAALDYGNRRQVSACTSLHHTCPAGRCNARTYKRESSCFVRLHQLDTAFSLSSFSLLGLLRRPPPDKKAE